MTRVSYPHSLAHWQEWTHNRIREVSTLARSLRSLKIRGPRVAWIIEVENVSACTMRALNQRYRHQTRVTDILSFGAPPLFFAQGILGQLVVCPAVVREQALRLQHSAQAEMTVLLVHGLLHLLGFDHDADPQDAKKMAHWEDQILTRLHLPNAGLIGRTG